MKTTLAICLAMCLIATAFAADSPASPVYKKVRKVSSRNMQVSGTENLLNVAKAIARSGSTSEVLTLNLTNLLILIVLKAVIFGIGLFYFGGVSFKGGHGGGGWSRSLDEKASSRPFMTEGEGMLMLTYLLGASNKDNYECMYRVACEEPARAKEYLNVSKMILKGAKFMKKYVSYNPKYEQIVTGLQDAIDHKRAGGVCSTRYVCADVPSLTKRS